jgi:anti-anti-sigma regulatory factor
MEMIVGSVMMAKTSTAAYNAFRLEDTVHTVMEKKVCSFIFNLKRVRYIDSSGSMVLFVLIMITNLSVGAISRQALLARV